MKTQTTLILLFFIVLLSCKAGQNHGFIKTRKEKKLTLTGAQAPHLVFVLQTKDTLRFSCRDVCSILEKQVKSQIKNQGYLTSQTWQDFSQIMKSQTGDTIVFQNLSAMNDNTLSGILDTWVARQLLLKGHGIVTLKGQANSLKKMKYVFFRDKLGGEEGNFYTDDSKLVYWTVIALGE